MGQSVVNCISTNMMKSVILAALVAVAYAEADADAWGGYRGGFLGGYRGYGGCGYRGYGAYGHRFHKRSADAEAEADASLLGYGAYGYAAPIASYAVAAPLAIGYAGYGYGAGIWKRSADSEA